MSSSARCARPKSGGGDADGSAGAGRLGRGFAAQRQARNHELAVLREAHDRAQAGDGDVLHAVVEREQRQHADVHAHEVELQRRHGLRRVRGGGGLRVGLRAELQALEVDRAADERQREAIPIGAQTGALERRAHDDRHRERERDAQQHDRDEQAEQPAPPAEAASRGRGGRRRGRRRCIRRRRRAAG
jgi:hypothetical protein